MKSMKRSLVGISTLLVMSSALAACGGNSNSNSTSPSSAPAPAANTTEAPAKGTGEKVTINLWSFTDEIPNMTKKYLEIHPDANVEFKTTVIATTDGAYQPALDQALTAGAKMPLTFLQLNQHSCSSIHKATPQAMQLTILI